MDSGVERIHGPGAFPFPVTATLANSDADCDRVRRTLCDFQGRAHSSLR
jgi:hypothetical protein